MPNWVFCNAYITGPAEDMARFIAAARKGNRFFHKNIDWEDWGSFTDIKLEALMNEASIIQAENSKDDFSFHALYPVPLPVQIMPYDEGMFSDLVKNNPTVAAFCKKHGVTMGGYSWECSNWGVKWGNCSTHIEEVTDTFMHIYFETAWAAAHAFWRKVSADYPSLSIKMDYSEEAGHFEGEATYKNGAEGVQEWEPEFIGEDVE